MSYPVKKLLEVCDFKVVKNTKSLPYVGMEDIESNTGRFIGSRDIQKVKSTTSYFDDTCVLYGKLRPYLNKVFVPNFEGHCSTEFLPLRPDQRVLSREWLATWLMSGDVVSQINLQTSGARMPRANISFLKDLKIPVPPIEEQRRIVEKLEKQFAKIDEAARLRAESISATDQLLPAALHEIFSSTESNEWEVTTLQDVCEKTSNIKWGGKVGEQSFKYIDLSSVSRENSLITGTHEVNSRNAPSRARKLIEINDIIFGTTRPTLMRVAIIPPEYDKQLCSTGFAVLRAKKEKILPRFIYFFLRSDDFMSRMEALQTGASYPAVSDTKVMETKIPLPPLAEQKRIVQKLDALSEKIRVLRELQLAQSADLKALKQSILHEAFSGNI